MRVNYAVLFFLSMLAASVLHANSKEVQVKQLIKNNSGTSVQAGRDAYVTIYQKSQDYLDLLSQRNKWKDQINKYPGDASIQEEYKLALQKLENFEKDVLKLADDIRKHTAPINTERLKLATQLFEKGDYKSARNVLDTRLITEEQDVLLAKKQSLVGEQSAVQKQLDDKAEEWLLKARLTEIDYSLDEQRIGNTSQYFELALKSGRTSIRLLKYAIFLEHHNQPLKAAKQYQEALLNMRVFSMISPDENLIDVVVRLVILADLVGRDSTRRAEAEKLYQEAMIICRNYAVPNPGKYWPLFECH